MLPVNSTGHSQISFNVPSSCFDERCYPGSALDNDFVSNIVSQDVVVFLEGINGIKVLV